MLDDAHIIDQRDTLGALEVAETLYKQTSYPVQLVDTENDNREIKNIIVTGMGGSALAADFVKVLLERILPIPFEVIKGYELPEYAQQHTLVIASSHSGNTEETITCLNEAIRRDCQLAAIATGGQVQTIATEHHILFGAIPHDTQPRMGMIYNLRVLLAILQQFGLIDDSLSTDMSDATEWLHAESSLWIKEAPTERNYAKQLALQAVGKTPVFYGGSLMAPVAYKWKISWNENAKNVAFWNYFPEFNHNEFLGWTSHPIEKPFAVFDLVSELENPRIIKRFSLSDRLLSGLRPKSIVVPMTGSSLLRQMLWGCILADFVSIYVAILNNVDPTQVDLIEKFKRELAQ